jgi:hypothetical protein
VTQGDQHDIPEQKIHRGERQAEQGNTSAERLQRHRCQTTADER